MITQPKQSDPFGNPQIGGIARESVPPFYADFYGKPSSFNNRHTVNEYWMEQTHGRLGMSFTPYGPYRMPRPLKEDDLQRASRSSLAASGVQVMRVKARTVEPGGDGTLTKLDMDGTAPVDKTPACDTNTDPLCAGPGGSTARSRPSSASARTR